MDAAKGIGIILVILGHAFRDEMRIESVFCEFAYLSIYFFHMALFFAISGLAFGMSYRKYLKTPILFIKRKVQSQIIPVISYATAIYVCFFVAFQIPFIRQALSATGYQMHSYLKYLGLTALWDNPYSVHLWYLWVLFIATVTVFLYFRSVSDNLRTKLCLIAIALVLYMLRSFLMLPYVLLRLFEYSIYFAGGVLLSAKMELLLHKSKILDTVSVLSCLCILVYCAFSAMQINMGIIDQPQVRACWKLVVTVFIIFGVLRLSCKLENCKPLLYCGRETYSIYLLHQPFCCGFVGVILYNKLNLPALPVYLICCALSILLPAVFVAVCRQIKPIGKISKTLLNIT